MSIGVIIAVIVVAALIFAAVAMVLPRLRAGSRPGRRGPVRRREPAATENLEETEIREDDRRPRRERTLIAEGESIREHVEAQIDADRAVRPHGNGRPPLPAREPAAWEMEQPLPGHAAPIGEPGYVGAAPAADPMVGRPGYAPAADPIVGRPGYASAADPMVGTPGYAPAADPLVGGPGYASAAGPMVGGPGYAPAADPMVGTPGYVGAPRDLLSARDQLAWQVEQDERARHPEAYAGRPSRVAPLGGGLQPEQLPVSDALELQLQEIAVRARRRPAAAPVVERRRRMGFPRSRRADVGRDDDRLAP